MKHINETLKKVANATQKGNTATLSSIKPMDAAMPGDPNCPVCGGIGYLREDLPITDPNFGKVVVCACRQRAVSQFTQSNLYRFSNIEALKHMTFDTFNASGRLGLSDDALATLNYAVSQSMNFSRQLKGWLLLTGTYGCGKTHLAAAIANEAVNNGVKALFLTVPDLLDWLRFSFSSGESSYEERFEEIRQAPLLILDDLGTQNTTPWAQEKLFQIIDYRYIRRMPTAITTNLTMAEIEDRVRSRMLDPEVVTVVKISAPDYRAPVTESHDPLIYALSLLSDRTFGNFSMREPEKLKPEEKHSLELAFHAAQQFAEKPKGWIMLLGDFSVGKTHLAAAIGNYRRGLGEEPVMIAVPDLLDHLRATFSPSSNVSFDERFERVKNSPLLILDDLGTQSATPWAREKLYQIFNYRYMARLPMVITTSNNLEELDARIRSRMVDGSICKIVGLMVPAYRTNAGKTEKIRRTRLP